MCFKDRLKNLRKEAGFTQAELAEQVGITSKTIQNYELGKRKPQNIDLVQRLADVLDTSTEYLMGKSTVYIMEARKRGGGKAAHDINELVQEVTGLFAGGKLDESSLDGAMKALTDAYWLAKEKNKKYAPQKSVSPKT